MFEVHHTVKVWAPMDGCAENALAPTPYTKWSREESLICGQCSPLSLRFGFF